MFVRRRGTPGDRLRRLRCITSFLACIRKGVDRRESQWTLTIYFPKEEHAYKNNAACILRLQGAFCVEHLFGCLSGAEARREIGGVVCVAGGLLLPLLRVRTHILTQLRSIILLKWVKEQIQM